MSDDTPSTRPGPRDPSRPLEPERRPVPGPRNPRRIWTGETERWLSEVSGDPSQPMRNVAGGGDRTSSRYLQAVVERDRRRKRGRVSGIDAARGFALLGMFAVHILPAATDDRATVVWTLFAGNSAALFALLAGAALAFSTGGQRRQQGRTFARSSVQIVARAVLLALLGLAINGLGLPVFNILVYFAILFILALPFLRLPSKILFVLGFGLILLMPVVRWVIHIGVEGLGYYPNPTLSDVVADPLGVLSTLTVTGVYPAATWIAFICLGIGIGRLPLQNSGPRLALTVAGLLSALAATAASLLIIDRFNGYEKIAASMPDADESAVDEFIVYGPDGQLPIESPGWLLANAPHSNTPFALLTGAGFALACVGIFIMLSRWSSVLMPLIDLGTMPATLYMAHLVFMKFAPDSLPLITVFLVQALGAIIFATLWRLLFRRGPLEVLISQVSRSVSNIVIPRPTQSAETSRR